MDINDMLKAIEVFSGARSIKQKNRAVVEMIVLQNALDRIIEQYKPALIKAEVYECFPEYGLKIEYAAPKSSSSIDAVKCAKKLIKDDRINDLLSVINITEKAISSLVDGEALAEKFRAVGDNTKAGVKVGKMTKEELKTSLVSN